MLLDRQVTNCSFAVAVAVAAATIVMWNSTRCLIE